MLNKFFKKAKPIYPTKYLEQMNISLFFAQRINLTEKAKINITANELYRLFDNGKLIGYGPSRAAKGFYRIDTYELDKGEHYIIIEHYASGCNSMYFSSAEPFLVCEIFTTNKVIAYTSNDNDFKCYLNKTRYVKVSRFSFQRTFSESYHFDFGFKDFLLGKINPLEEVKCDIFKHKQYLNKNVVYQTFPNILFKQIEKGTFKFNRNIKPYRDRYMLLDYLKIFPIDEWEVNPNDYISKLEYSLDNSIDKLKKGTFITYELDKSKTGFIEFEIECLRDSEIYFIFDEVDSSCGKEVPLSIKFYRNTTQNIVSYEIKKGRLYHLCFEPYTIKYLRLVIAKGEIKVHNVSLRLYETIIDGFKYEFENKRIQTICDAAVSTFAQNSVDILTDCPSRERAGWLFDSYFTSMSEYLLTNKNIVERNFLENYALAENMLTLPKNMIPMCYPGEFPDGNFIPNWSMWYVLELKNYYQRTGDKILIDKSLPKVKMLLDYFKNFENELGLLENLQGWIFIEWSKANDDEFIKGINFPSNMVYSKMLICAGELLNDNSLIEKGHKLIKTIQKYAYNGTFFVDNMIRNDNGEFELTNNITETCQYYAFYFDIANKKNYPSLFENLLKFFGPTRDYEKVYPKIYKSNVLIGDYLRLFIFLKYNHLVEVADESISYFYKMAELTGTLWEHDTVFASLNHGLTSCILVIFCQAIFSLVRIDSENKVIYLKKEHLKEKGELIIKVGDYEEVKLINNGDDSLGIYYPKDYRCIYVDET